jgi:transcriptional regulator of acetoin/glycerol metabolism
MSISTYPVSSDAQCQRMAIFSAWEKFVQTGAVEPGVVRPEIAQSWLRCREAGVNPFAGSGTTTLARPLLEELLERRKKLIAVARPFMDNLSSFVAASNFVVILSDERGYLMDAVGDSKVINGDNGLYLHQGALWAEGEIGSNGVGTSLFLKKPFQVSGAEHYCQVHHPWTCSGAPIFDDDHRIIGVLEMTGLAEKSHLHTLGMVVAAVEAIHDQLRIQEQNYELTMLNRELTLLNNRMTNIFSTVSDGVVVVNVQGDIKQANPVAEKILAKPGQQINGTSIRQYFERYDLIEEILITGGALTDLELIIKSGMNATRCLVSAKPITDDRDSLTGGVIFINPINKIKNLINRFSGAHATFTFEDIIGNGRAFNKATSLGILAARNSSNVLLTGESGTGKEMFAQAIHNRSGRQRGPFVAINCGAIPRELVDSELFGYTDGSFTGARRGGRPGKFELASGGTLFLDEIGDMPLEQQVSLLRVLQDKTITRIGGDQAMVVDVRIICATNKNLPTEVVKGNFREDLYYRLNVISISLPPLREHPDDIPLMFKVFCERTCRRLGISNPQVDQMVITRLQQYGWPGNVREFQNVVERMVNIANGQAIGMEHLPEELLSRQPVARNTDMPSHPEPINITKERKIIKEQLAEREQEEILDLFHQYKGNITQVARGMGISRRTVYRKLNKLHVDF